MIGFQSYLSFIKFRRKVTTNFITIERSRILSSQINQGCLQKKHEKATDGFQISPNTLFWWFYQERLNKKKKQ